VVRGSVDKDINVAIIEDPPEILNEFGPSVLGFFDRFARPGKPPGIGIAEIGDFRVRAQCKTLSEVCPSTTQSHHAYHNLLVRSAHLAL
jgi:hypothetical protein